MTTIYSIGHSRHAADDFLGGVTAAYWYGELAAPTR